MPTLPSLPQPGQVQVQVSEEVQQQQRPSLQHWEEQLWEEQQVQRGGRERRLEGGTRSKDLSLIGLLRHNLEGKGESVFSLCGCESAGRSLVELTFRFLTRRFPVLRRRRRLFFLSCSSFRLSSFFILGIRVVYNTLHGHVFGLCFSHFVLSSRPRRVSLLLSLPPLALLLIEAISSHAHRLLISKWYLFNGLFVLTMVEEASRGEGEKRKMQGSENALVSSPVLLSTRSREDD